MNIFLNSTKGKEEAISGLVSLGDFVYISGQYGKGDDVIAQTRSACRQIQEQLQHMKLCMYHIVKTTIYVTDFSDKEKVLKEYQTFFEAPYPAATVVQVDGLGDDVKVCIEGMAIDTRRFEKQQACSDCADC